MKLIKQSVLLASSHNPFITLREKRFVKLKQIPDSSPRITVTKAKEKKKLKFGNTELSKGENSARLSNYNKKKERKIQKHCIYMRASGQKVANNIRIVEKQKKSTD